MFFLKVIKLANNKILKKKEFYLCPFQSDKPLL